MKAIIIFLFTGIVCIVGCIEDPEEFTSQDIYNETNDTIIMLSASLDSIWITADTILPKFQNIQAGIFLDNYLENIISVELIKLSDNKSVVYYRSDINNNNYQATIDKNIFNVDNWEERTKYGYDYYIREEHFD